jgi:UDP-N-acetyl-alpha-D-quinovosamine dehydrogenase
MPVRPVFRNETSVVRTGRTTLPAVIQSLEGAAVDWSAALRGVNAVVHCAARVHLMNETEPDTLAAFRKVNVDGTLNLAQQAARAGVSRFVFISSIKVNGESTMHGRAYTADDVPAPEDAYGISKTEAETGLRHLGKQAAMEITIIRPVLVYGPGVKANFLSMMRWVRSGVPLPLGCVTENLRSMVALDNLVDLILTCVDHPKAANQTFLVSDGEDVSTVGLLRRMGTAMGCPVRLFPVPVWLLKLAARLLGRNGIAQRLCGSLQVDITKTRALLGWAPPVSMDEALRRVCERRA